MNLETLPVVEDDTQELTTYVEEADEGEHLAHIVNPPNNLHIWVLVFRKHVVALCGYTWIPNRNPDKYPACETCMRIAGDLMRSKGE